MDKPFGTKRALRRQHNARMKQRARQIYPHDPAAKQADHLASCSCPMCGNPRKHFKERTRQEAVAELQEFDASEDA